MNTEILSNYQREAKYPFGTFVIEVLSMIPHSSIAELMKVFTSLPLPLLVKSPARSQKVTDFNSYIQECIENRSAQGLKQLVAIFKEGKFNYAEKEREDTLKEIVRELILAIFALGNYELSPTRAPVKDIYHQLVVVILHLLNEADSNLADISEINNLIQNYLLHDLSLPKTSTALKEIWYGISKAIKDDVLADSGAETDSVKISISSKQSKVNGIILPSKQEKSNNQDFDSLRKQFTPYVIPLTTFLIADYHNWKSNYFGLSVENLARGANSIAAQFVDINKILMLILRDVSTSIKEIASFNKTSANKQLYPNDDCVNKFLKLCAAEQPSIPQNPNDVTYSYQYVYSFPLLICRDKQIIKS